MTGRARLRCSKHGRRRQSLLQLRWLSREDVEGVRGGAELWAEAYEAREVWKQEAE